MNRIAKFTIALGLAAAAAACGPTIVAAPMVLSSIPAWSRTATA